MSLDPYWQMELMMLGRIENTHPWWRQQEGARQNRESFRDDGTTFSRSALIRWQAKTNRRPRGRQEKA